jgi:RimJ/RimL family protein N-acetyltransferase
MSRFRFERTADLDLVCRVMTHPKVYRGLVDDNSPPAADFRPAEHPSIWYVTVYRDEDLLGLWMLVPENSICWHIHTALLPNAWGETALCAANYFKAWLWENTTCQRLITAVPETNRIALRFAQKTGMKEYGRNPRSFLRRGKLIDQILLGLSPACERRPKCQQP